MWCAASTHYNEEVTIGHLHKKLKMKTRKLLTIIIPRHINRSNEIINNLENIDLKIHRHSSNNKITDETDIYLVDTFGEAKSFTIYQILHLWGDHLSLMVVKIL